MAVYQYVAKDRTGKKFAGIYTDVEDVTGIRDELAKIGCVLVKARRKDTQSLLGPKKVKRSEVATFAYKFAGMYSAGLSIVNCLETLEEQSENPTFKAAITDIKQNIQTGASLKSACEKYRNIFSDFFLGMLEAGESGGKLAETLNMSAVYLEKQVDVRRKVFAAFAYPVIVTVMCLAVIAFLLIFVIPVFMKLYRQANVPLPGPTRILMSLSFLFIKNWWITLVVLAVAAVALRWLFKKPQVRAWWDEFKLKMPVFGKLNSMLAASHFTRTLAMLASVGVSLIEALDVARAVANNHRLNEITEELQQEIKAGNPVSKSLKKYSLFPPLIIQMAASGEQAGQLPEMLNKGADLLDKDIDKTISALLTKLEPALTLTMGTVVALILLGAYLPMFDYMGHLK